MHGVTMKFICSKVAVVRQRGELAPGDFHLFVPSEEA